MCRVKVVNLVYVRIERGVCVPCEGSEPGLCANREGCMCAV